ncbi:ABC transporter substrate-binding protein [Caldalkalibacillus mannanilyticus]|uniref:ABC transporter substrate-binding protein n=1 Tax=Caldalkalibacillus mannanilyticus TaxID=1418 RepID=UPI0004689788|nr:ABC transporter substrate-binding protein [Caldalkalibacillus mannanilyticus]
MKISKRIIMTLIVLLVISTLVGCTSKAPVESQSSNEGTGEPKDPTEISGNITVLTQRTDIVDTVFQEYAKRFNEQYPNVKVSFEAFTDYEGQTKIRMNTTDYGDVLLIPNDIPLAELSTYFESLGSLDELSKTYRFADEREYQGTVYGLPIVVNASGIVYNKTVFEQAGITSIPSTPDEFLAAMKKIKENTEAIPYYTNYVAGWTLNQWEDHRLSVAGDPSYVNRKMIDMDDPFALGKPHYIVYKLLYDLVKEGLVERDPFTTDWESSKVMLAKGEIGAMVLGSWAISQVQELADHPEDIGYMPFPYQKDGVVYTASSGDYKMAVNKNSKHKEAAMAWLWWFMNESGYAKSQGGISPLLDGEFPETLKSFEELNVEFIANTPARAGEEGIIDEIDQVSEVGLWQPDFKQRIVEAAVGNRKESFDDIMNDLNQKWKKGREQVR